MKAAIYKNKENPLVLQDIEFSNVDGRMPIDLKYAALNHRDVWITKGMYPGLKGGITLGSDGVGMMGDRPVLINPGLDWGDREAVQSDDFRVLGMPDHGTFAEKISVDTKYLYDLPTHLTLVEAAALPLAGVTAYRVLMSRCKVEKGETLLISGIGGGVALFAAQYAIALGCKVYVTSGSEAKIEKAIEMGAQGGVNYRKQDWHKELKTLAGGFDVIIDSAGGESFKHFIKLCKPGARIGFYGAGRGNYQDINPQILFWRQISLLGSTMGSDKDFGDMLGFVEYYGIKPVIDEVFSLNDIHHAFAKMERGDQFGKIVVGI